MTTLNKITLLVVLFSVYSIAQVSITSTNFTYSQNFNTLNPLYGPHKFNNNITLPGWYLYNPSIQPPDTVTYTGQDGGEESGLRYLRLNNQAIARALGSCSVNDIGD